MKRLTISDYEKFKIPPPAGTKERKRPSYMDLYQRLSVIEDILGEEYELDQLQKTIQKQIIMGYCKDCYNWNEQFSAGRKSLNNYVCYCSEWSDPENGYRRYTLPSDYCSYFEPKEALKDGKGDND